MSAVEDNAQTELAEYEDAITKLIDDVHFRRLLVQLYVQSKPLDPGMMTEEMLLAYNFAQGQRMWVHSVFAWVEQTNPAAYFNLITEVHQYEYRRRDAHRRDAEPDPGGAD